MSKLRNIFFSFPIQLFLLNLRKHGLLIGSWILLMLLLSGSIAREFGIKFLFLDPEYLGEVSFWSFMIVGGAFGGFLMVWNITCYLLNSHRFPFLASLTHPFVKFCINNSVLPLVFMLFYFGFTIRFQYYNEYASSGDIFMYCFGFLVGLVASLLINVIYFETTNKDIFKFLKQEHRRAPGKMIGASAQRTAQYSQNKWDFTKWQVKYYLSARLKVRIVRNVSHYNPKILQEVFRQHHTNALIFQVGGILGLITLGLLMDNEWFRVPAGASIFIIFALLISISGAFKYWLRTWRMPTLVVLLLLINYFTSFETLNYQNKAYGLNYEDEKAAYTYDNFDKIASNYEEDKQNTIQILDNWKSKFSSDSIDKPKIIFLNVSGGGARAGVWATKVIQAVDSATNGQLLNNTILISGASGGMIGATYMREVYLQQQLGNNKLSLYDAEHIDRMSDDLLNPVAFTIAVNDIFLPWIKFKTEKGYVYRKDRGYVFENQLIENSDSLLYRKLKDYTAYEKNGTIPMLFLSPTIMNDARRFIISAHPVSYMMRAPHNHPTAANDFEYDAVDFYRFFENQDVTNLRLTSALRMNATYPYILPNVHLPSYPDIEVMDAGWRDNYGTDAAMRFAHIFKDWILENTSGVVFVQIRASEKLEPLETYKQGIIEHLFNPLGVAGQFMEIQDFHQDGKLGYLYDILGDDMVNIFRFIYQPNESNERASMSFHLTEREKRDIISAMNLEYNQKMLESVKAVLE